MIFTYFLEYTITKTFIWYVQASVGIHNEAKFELAVTKSHLFAVGFLITSRRRLLTLRSQNADSLQKSLKSVTYWQLLASTLLSKLLSCTGRCLSNCNPTFWMCQPRITGEWETKLRTWEQQGRRRRKNHPPRSQQRKLARIKVRGSLSIGKFIAISEKQRTCDAMST